MSARQLPIYAAAQPPDAAMAGQSMRVAIVHEWFETYAGSERVVEQMLNVFPQADVFALADFMDDKDRGFLQGKTVHTTFVQRLPRARRSFRNYLPFMPLAIEQLDVSDYQLVLSSSHAVAKGVLTGPDQVHVSYVHSPMRYAWDLQHQYLREAGLLKGLKAWIVRAVLHYIRLWDVRTAPGVDLFISNSAFIGRRIRKAYGRESVVVYPPVDVDSFRLETDKQDYYLTAARMVPYKKMALIVEAFTAMPDKKLRVIGDGPDMARCRALAGPNVEFLGHLPRPEFRRAMESAQAFVFAAEEDFGITMVEAQACGTPVIAFGRGGASEIVVPRGSGPEPTGVLFGQQTVESIREAVESFEAHRADIRPSICRANAERFSIRVFRRQFTQAVASAMAQLSK